MKKILYTIILILFLGACSSNLEYNEAIERNNKRLTTAPMKSDARFLVDAKSNALLINELAELAIQNGYASTIPGFSAQLIQFYNQLNTQLAQLAKNEKISLPETMSPSHNQLLEDVRNASRQEFDRKFVRTIERIFEDNIELFNSVATTGNSDEVRAFAAKNLRLLKVNQEKANELDNQLLN